MIFGFYSQFSPSFPLEMWVYRRYNNTLKSINNYGKQNNGVGNKDDLIGCLFFFTYPLRHTDVES